MSDKSVDLNNIDWNNFSIASFQELHKKFSVERKPRKKRAENNQKTVIKLGNKTYEIPSTEFERYKSLKNEKAKSKFRENVMKKYAPLGEL